MTLCVLFWAACMDLLGHACHALRTAATGLLRTAGWMGRRDLVAFRVPWPLAWGRFRLWLQSKCPSGGRKHRGSSYMVRVQGRLHHSHYEQQILSVYKTSWVQWLHKKVISQYIVLAQDIGWAYSYRGEVSICRHKLFWKMMSTCLCKTHPSN